MLRREMPRATSVTQRFARALRARRETLRLTQEEAADRAGLNVRFWRTMEAARSAPGLETVGSVLASVEWTWHDLADAMSTAEAKGAPAGTHRLLDEAWQRGSRRERDLLVGSMRVLLGRRPG